MTEQQSVPDLVVIFTDDGQGTTGTFLADTAFANLPTRIANRMQRDPEAQTPTAVLYRGDGPAVPMDDLIDAFWSAPEAQVFLAPASRPTGEALLDAYDAVSATFASLYETWMGAARGETR